MGVSSCPSGKDAQTDSLSYILFISEPTLSDVAAGSNSTDNWKKYFSNNNSLARRHLRSTVSSVAAAAVAANGIRN
jgi:hypothetical protein